MLEHIVKQNEKITDILNNYHLTLEEVKKYNTHITDFNNLIGGTKLMIPLIKQEINQILDKTEVFVKNYYPKITEEIIPKLEENQMVEASNRKDNLEPIDNDNVSFLSEEKKEEVNITKKGKPYPGILPPKGPYRKI